VVIPRGFVDDMVSHARDGSPEEVCGILAGRDGQVSMLYRITNSEHSERFYVMDSQEHLRAQLDIDDRNLEVVGVYHSHPASEPRPSKTDIELARWPAPQYVIVSLRDPSEPEIRCWRIEDGNASETHFQVPD